MDLEKISSIFCPCGGILIPHEKEDERVLICPLCGKQSNLPEDTSRFQIRLLPEHQ